MEPDHRSMRDLIEELCDLAVEADLMLFDEFRGPGDTNDNSEIAAVVAEIRRRLA